MSLKHSSNFLKSSKILKYLLRNVSYVQGQEPEPKVREYFYFIDHQGMVSELFYLLSLDEYNN